MSEGNIDEEFERIIAGMEESDTDEPAPQPDDRGTEDEQVTQEEVDPDQPVDESLHLEQGTQRIGLIFAPLRPASAVARMLGMYKIARWIVPIDHQIVLYLELDPDDGEEEFASLLGEERPMPEEVDRFAKVISKLSKFGAVAVVSTLAEEDSLVAGSVYARRYVNGQPEEAIPAGLLINSIDIRAEDLLLGRSRPQDYPDAVHATERPVPKGRGFGFPKLP